VQIIDRGFVSGGAGAWGSKVGGKANKESQEG